MEYDAFISYAHESEALALALEDALEHFTRPFYSRTLLMRVCRDKSTFTSGELSDAMHNALDGSGHLVVLLSPEAAASHYVDLELVRFLEQRQLLQKEGSKPVSFVIDRWSQDQDGAPLRDDFAWPVADLTPSMRNYFTEPLVVDMREHVRNGTLTLKNKKFADKVASVAGAVLEKDKDELIGNAIVMRAKGRAAVVAAAILVAAILIAVPGWFLARSAQRTAESRRATAEREVIEATNQLQELDTQLVMANSDLVNAQTLLTDAETNLAGKVTELAEAESTLMRVESDLKATEAARSLAVVERNLAQAARDSAERLRDAAAVARDQAQEARDAAVVERDAAAVARDVAAAARDAAQSERDAAESDRDVAIVARDAATLEAERQLTIADARRLSGLALANLDDDVPLASLLAAESVNRSIAGASSGDAAAFAQRADTPQPVYESRAALMRTIQTRPRLVAELQSNAGTIGDIAASADGTMLAGAGEGRIQFWNTSTHQTSREIDVPTIETGQSLAIQPGGDLIAIGGVNQHNSGARVTLVEASTGLGVATLTPPVDSAIELEGLEFSPDGRWLAVTSTSLIAGDVAIRVWDVRNGFRSVDLDAGGHTALSFSPDGRWLASGGNSLQIWNVGSWDRHVVPEGAADVRFRAVVFAGDTLFASSSAGPVRSWNATTFKSIENVTTFEEGSEYGSLATKNGRVAAVANDSDVEMLDTPSLSRVGDTISTGGAVGRIVFTGTDRLATLGGGVVSVWHETNDHPLGEFVEGKVLALFEDTVVVRDGEIARLLDRSTGTNVAVRTPRTDDVVQSFQFSADGAIAVGLSESPTAGKRLVVWNRDGSVRHTLVPRGGSPAMVALATDGSKAAIAGDDFIEFWAPGTGAFDGELPIGGGSSVRHIGFGAGTTLFVAFDDSISTWNVAAAARIQHVADAFSGSGYAVGSDGTSVTIASQRQISRRSLPDLDVDREFLLPSQGQWGEVAISADGGVLAASADTGEILWWDVGTGLPLGDPIRPHEQIGIELPVVLFGSSGTTLATYPAAISGPARLWDLDVSSLTDRACTRANRNLTQDEWARYLPRVAYRVTCPQFPPGR